MRPYSVAAEGRAVVGSIVYYTPDSESTYYWERNLGAHDISVRFSFLLQQDEHFTYPGGISPSGRYIVGQGTHRWRDGNLRLTGYFIDLQGTPPCDPHNGDVDENRCVDDADLLAVLFAFGQSGQGLGRVDVNCDGVVDDADLLTVLFNFGSGC